MLAVLFTVMSTFYIDLLWYREIDQSGVFWTELRTKVAARCGVRVAVLRAALREPVGHPPPRAAPPAVPDSGAGGDRARAHGVRADPRVGVAGRRRGAGAPGRHRGLAAVAGVPALAELERHRVRQPRAAVRPRPGLLHLLAAVAEVPAGVAVLGVRRGDVPDGDRALLLGRHPAAGAHLGGAGRSRDAGPPIGAARPDHADQGLGLLPRPLRPADLASGRGPGRVVHRRQRAAPGAQLPDHRGGDLCGALLREHLAAAVGAPDHRRDRAGRRLGACSARHTRRSCSGSG